LPGAVAYGNVAAMTMGREINGGNPGRSRTEAGAGAVDA
jgi:hypothetical protein